MLGQSVTRLKVILAQIIKDIRRISIAAKGHLGIPKKQEIPSDPLSGFFADTHRT